MILNVFIAMELSCMVVKIGNCAGFLDEFIAQSLTQVDLAIDMYLGMEST